MDRNRVACGGIIQQILRHDTNAGFLFPEIAEAVEPDTVFERCEICHIPLQPRVGELLDQIVDPVLNLLLLLLLTGLRRWCLALLLLLHRLLLLDRLLLLRLLELLDDLVDRFRLLAFPLGPARPVRGALALSVGVCHASTGTIHLLLELLRLLRLLVLRIDELLENIRALWLFTLAVPKDEPLRAPTAAIGEANLVAHAVGLLLLKRPATLRVRGERFLHAPVIVPRET